MTDKKSLNLQQTEAVKHLGGPLLIIAGAGTGKTTVITERIKYLILKKNILPSQILALTFTDKAAREMEERVDVAMPYGYTQMWISTFHAFCDRVLRSEAIHIGLNPSYKLLTEAESILFLRKNLFKFNLKYFRPLGNPNKFLEGMLQHFSRLKDEDISPKEYLLWANKSRPKDGRPLDEKTRNLELANAFKTYEELKIKEGAMDFSDLISNTLNLFRERKNILTIYQEQFQHILVDEFQDTNFSQNELSILLVGKGKNITVVGDDDQAIYRWRGAAISNMIQFRKHFPKAKIITLTQNYRCTKEILKTSYEVIQNNNPDRLEAKEKISKKLISVRNIQGEKIEFLFGERVEDEAEQVAKQIQDIVENEKLRYKDIAILVRANDHSTPFVRALERASIPYQFLGPGQLFQQEEIKDLIAYLKVLYNFEDSASLYRVLNMPIFQIQARDIAAVLNFAKRKNLSLFEALEQIEETFLTEDVKKKIGSFVEMILKHLKRIPKDTGGQILYYFLEDSGLLKKFINAETQTEEKKSQNIAKFFDKLKAYEVEHDDSSVFAIIDWIDLSMQMGESPMSTNIDWTDNNAVNILTIHSSKGLEFPCVFVTNLIVGRFPTRERKEQIPIPQDLIKEILPTGDYHIQEERRLFYVALTRARDFLFLTAAHFYGERKRERKISPFVYESIGEKRILEKTKKENLTKSQLSLFEWNKSESIKIEKPTIPLPITYLSYSQIQTFEICPLHYKLKYLLKIPTRQSAAQSFGTSLHATLRDFYQQVLRGEELKPQDALSLLNSNWINEGYSSKDHEKEALEKAGKTILEYILKDRDSSFPLALELPFKFSLGQLQIGGRIDRIDKLKNNQIEILDYKTGSNIPDQKTLSNNPQLTTYALAATMVKDQLLNKKPEEVILSLYYLEEGKKLTTTRTKEQLEKAKEWLLAKAQEIATSDFVCSKSSLCVKCEYKMLCSA